MKYLLDTNVLIWFLAGDPKLSMNARSLIGDPSNEIYTSIASLWEMAIKVSMGKLNLALSFEDLFPKQLEDNDIQILDVSVSHLHWLCRLPFHHRDPFDRVIAAQALIETLPLISSDVIFDDYGVVRTH